MRRYTAAGLWTLLFSLIFGLFVGVQPAIAETSTSCDSGFGAKVPVLLVHGFDSNPRMWLEGNPSMEKTLRKMQEVYVTRSFSYEDNHFDWVTNDNIGPKLARAIDCLAQTSRKEGGAGKVIVVAHSMGGLAARFAANQTVDGRKVADELGPLGTPNTGSSWATAFGDQPRAYCRLLVDNSLAPEQRMKEVGLCWASSAITAMREGSDELSKLPRFPDTVPVRAIAGQVTLYAQYPFGDTKQPLSDDLIVPVKSALAEYTDMGVGDGRFVFSCDLRHYDSYGLEPMKGGQCTHNEMYKTGYVQQSVTNGISDYLASRSVGIVPKPDFSHFASGRVLTVLSDLAIPAPEGWQLSLEKPGFVNFSDDTACDEQRSACPHVHFISTTPDNTGGDLVKLWTNGHASCSSGAPGRVDGPAPASVGGQSAQLYRQYCGNAPRYAWIVPSKQLYIGIDEGGNAEILEGALEKAVWK
jgi:pimeloyl-ACP methyl ester carboxylesterase